MPQLGLRSSAGRGGGAARHVDRGARDDLATHIGDRFGIRPGETTTDSRLTLLPIVCLGHCDHAPALMVNDTLYGDIDIAALDRLLTTLIEEPS
jgi:NADH-quinone oxidoreductase subunit E